VQGPRCRAWRLMMPNPFTPPPEGAPAPVSDAYRAWEQAFDREQVARVQLETATRALAFAEEETNRATQRFLDTRGDAQQTA
jgi:hypothetical protein